MKRIVTAATVFVIWLSAVDVASAQTALERLEQQLREQSDRPPGEDELPQRGYLGVLADDRADRGRGVRILEVLPNGPADKAGLQAQDLITGIGGVRVRQMVDMAAILGRIFPGDTLPFELLRGQQRQEVEVTFGRRPPPEERRFQHAERAAAGRPAEPPETPPDGPQEDRGRIEMLELRIRQLEQRVEQLERRLLER